MNDNIVGNENAVSNISPNPWEYRSHIRILTNRLLVEWSLRNLYCILGPGCRCPCTCRPCRSSPRWHDWWFLLHQKSDWSFKIFWEIFFSWNVHLVFTSFLECWLCTGPNKFCWRISWIKKGYHLLYWDTCLQYVKEIKFCMCHSFLVAMKQTIFSWNRVML